MAVKFHDVESYSYDFDAASGGPRPARARGPDERKRDPLEVPSRQRQLRITNR